MLTYTTGELSFHLIYRRNTVGWPYVTHTTSRRRTEERQNFWSHCIVSMEGNIIEAEINVIHVRVTLRFKKAFVTDTGRKWKTESEKRIFGRNAIRKYCGRGTDVRCRKNEISLLMERTIIYKLILPTHWQEALCTTSLSPNKVSLDHTLSFTLSFPFPYALLTVTMLWGENDLKHTHSNLKS